MNSPTEPPPAIHIRGLKVIRGGRPVLGADSHANPHDDHPTAHSGLPLIVPTGSVPGPLGPSGCGKSTLMRAIVGVQRITAGTVHVLGQEAGSAPLRHRVGYVTQAPSVYSDLSVLENLRYFAAILGAPRTDPDRVITQVGLTGREKDQVGRLSGGQRARV